MSMMWYGRGVLFILALFLVPTVQAQNYPTKPVRVIVAWAPGGGTDSLARLIMPRVAERLGQQAIVDNRPGAGGFIGAEVAAKASPDGHTLFFASANLVMSLNIFPQQPVDPLRDFAPVSMLVTEPSLLAVHPSLPTRSVPELVALARKNPGRINYAGGYGTTMHLNTELFKMMAKVDLTQIPYAGGAAPSLVGVFAGEAAVILAPISNVLPHSNSGRLRALAITLPHRLSSLPNVPAVSEAIPGYSASVWYGVVVPQGTPVAVVQKLHEELGRVMQVPEVRSRLESEGSIVGSSTPQEFAAVMREDKAKWAKVVIKDVTAPR